MRVFILVFCFTLLFSCGGKKESSAAQAADLSLSTDTVTVTAHTSSLEKLSYPVKVIGKVRSTKRSNLLFEKTGAIQTVHFTNGDRVYKGEIIATLKNKEEQLQVQKAKIALSEALLKYENEMLTLGDSLYYKERWGTVKGNVELFTGVKAAEVVLKQLELAYQQTLLRAPFTGMVEGLDLQSGDFVSSNLSIGTIYDPTAYEVVCDILEYDVLKVKKGMDATISLLGIENSQLRGVVSTINPAVNSKGFSRATIQILTKEAILPGMSAKAEINVTDEPSILVPMMAVVKRSERHVVFNIEDGLAKWNYVTLGKDNGEMVQILDGLEENMEVAVSNNIQLAHDSPVRLE